MALPAQSPLLTTELPTSRTTPTMRRALIVVLALAILPTEGWKKRSVRDKHKKPTLPSLNFPTLAPTPILDYEYDEQSSKQRQEESEQRLKEARQLRKDTELSLQIQVGNLIRFDIF